MKEYYPINEKAARQSLGMWSYSDYAEGSETEAYKKQVDKVYTLAEKAAEARPEQEQKIYNLAERFARKYAEHINTGFQIELMCPSIMISGAGNFPVRKKEKQNARRDKHYSEYNYIMGIPEKIKSIVYGSSIIKSNDENAIEQLQEKIFNLTEQSEEGKAMNKHYRKYGTMKGFSGLNEEKALKLDTSIQNSWYKSPVAPFELTSIRNKIKEAEGRIKEIQRLKQSAEAEKDEPKAEYENSVCKVVENADIMRIQLFFEGKPSEEVRSILKSNGFRWAPSEDAWQRQLTDNGRYATKKVIKQLTAIV